MSAREAVRLGVGTAILALFGLAVLMTPGHERRRAEAHGGGHRVVARRPKAS